MVKIMINWSWNNNKYKNSKNVEITFNKQKSGIITITNKLTILTSVTLTGYSFGILCFFKTCITFFNLYDG